MKKALISLAILVALAGLSGCQRSIEPKAQAQVISREAITDTEVEAQEPKERHTCAGITKQGKRCRKPVKAEGDYCWMHASQDKRVKK